jgi:glycosyltransferase AglE
MNSNGAISVIIPNYNHGERLQKVLEALFAQDYPAEQVEIIVVDNGSTDNSKDIAKMDRVTFIEVDEPKNPYVCRNIAMIKASGNFIALLDATCVPASPSYLSILHEAIVNKNAGLAIGNIQFDLTDKPSLSEITDSLVFIPNKEGEGERGDYPGGALFFPRATLERIGHFREDMRSGADGEWTRRVFSAGLQIAYVDQAVVLYKPKSWHQLLRKAVRIGKGHHRLLKENGAFNLVGEMLRIRPPSPKYLNKVIDERGKPEFKKKFIQLTFSIWLYRLALGFGRIRG